MGFVRRAAVMLGVLAVAAFISGCVGGLARIDGATPADSLPPVRRLAVAESPDMSMPRPISRQTFYLAASGHQAGNHPFAFPDVGARAVEIELAPLGGAHVRLEFTCDGPMTVRAIDGNRRYRPGQRATLTVRDTHGTIPNTVFVPAEGLDRCEGWAHYPDSRRPFRIARETVQNPPVAALDALSQDCTLPRETGSDPLADAFNEPGPLSFTCPFRLPRPVLLAGEREGFDAKVEALLGRELPARFYRDGNPELPLDFSKAPKLSLIVVSYLDIKADFSGRVIDRLLRHHAARGTSIRILASAVLERPKDRAMLESLATDFPNVAYRPHLWRPKPIATPASFLAQFHRVNHAKLLAAVAEDPRRSVAIVGGRNIHDGFLFADPLDLSAHPRLQHYGAARGMTLNYYSNWRDIDLAFHDDGLARLLAAHLSTLWLEDARSRVARPIASARRGSASPREGEARHFLSVPYSDGRALERFYVSLFDAARGRIDIVNPYLNLTTALRAALDRALARGVEVTIVGRISLAGDLGGDLMTAINEEFVERYFERLKIYNYRDPKVLLHAKILSVDGRLAVVSGVNLNNRSFIHDTENGLVVLDRGFNRQVAEVVDGFRRDSDLVTQAPADSLLRLVLRVKMIREAL